MVETYDVAVIGAGTMGSSASYVLSKRGLRVVVFEQYGVVHDRGSHSGATRIIRHAYFESPDYVPLVMRSDKLWQELENEWGSPLLVRTGGIDAGPTDSTLVKGATLACQTHGLLHERFGAKEVIGRWPQFRFPDDWEACYDPQAGFLLVNDCIRAYLKFAQTSGAVVRMNEPVHSIHHTGTGEQIRTSSALYNVSGVIVTAGAWTSRLLQELGLPLSVKRRALTWLRAERPGEFSPDRFPVYLAQTLKGILYGFPVYGSSGLKIANHHYEGPAEDIEAIDRDFHESDAEDSRNFAEQYLNGVGSEILDGKICLYTLTPDGHFILDRHPERQNIVIAAGFSGHGFKFAPVVGEILADLYLNDRHEPLSMFRLNRF